MSDPTTSPRDFRDRPWTIPTAAAAGGLFSLSFLVPADEDELLYLFSDVVATAVQVFIDGRLVAWDFRLPVTTFIAARFPLHNPGQPRRARKNVLVRISGGTAGNINIQTAFRQYFDPPELPGPNQPQGG